MIDSDGKKQLGERVRKARLSLDLKQGDLAERVGVTQGVISNVENGVSTIAVPDLPRWAKALEQPLLYFIEDESVDVRERALAILSRFPPEQLEMVLQMLKGMATGLQSESNG